MINNGKRLRSFVQIMRSGLTGRKSLGTLPKRCIQKWLNTASDWQLLNAFVGRHPSLADVIKMVHSKPACLEREALFAWIEETRPDVPFQMLTSLPLTTQHSAKIAERGSWLMIRMNLNTFARHGVFELTGMPETIAAKLAN